MFSMEFPPVPGGVGSYVYNLSKKLIEKGHKTTVITPLSFKYALRQEIIDEIEIFRVPYLPVYPFHASLLGHFVNKTFKSLEHKFDIVHSHTPIPVPIKTSLPIITTVHTPMKIDGRYHEVDNLHSLAVKAQSLFFYPSLELKLFKTSQIITTVSKTVAGELAEYGLDPRTITVVGNGVDENIFRSNPYRVDCTQPYVLYTGVLRARKGIFDFIKSAEYVTKEFPDVKFVVCGSGRLLNKSIAYAQRLGLQKKVVFLGYIKKDRLISLFQNATAQVVPSLYEGLPTVLLEAMSCSLPVVATNIGGNNEVISSGVNGFLVPPKRPDAMAEAVSRLLVDTDLSMKLGAAARETIERCYTWDRVTDRFLKCYEELL
jgi:glycosyltransferase involved in cell wall biosynthesis